MSVSSEEADFYAKLARQKWDTFSPEIKMRKSKQDSLAAAEKTFSNACADDKHRMTILEVKAND